MRNLIYRVICTLRRKARTQAKYEYFDKLKARMDVRSFEKFYRSKSCRIAHQWYCDDDAAFNYWCTRQGIQFSDDVIEDVNIEDDRSFAKQKALANLQDEEA